MSIPAIFNDATYMFDDESRKQFYDYMDGIINEVDLTILQTNASIQKTLYSNTCIPEVIIDMIYEYCTEIMNITLKHTTTAANIEYDKLTCEYLGEFNIFNRKKLTVLVYNMDNYLCKFSNSDTYKWSNSNRRTPFCISNFFNTYMDVWYGKELFFAEYANDHTDCGYDMQNDVFYRADVRFTFPNYILFKVVDDELFLEMILMMKLLVLNMSDYQSKK